MGGGVLQLSLYGAQDIVLTGSPQVTFFKTVFRRHTNFSNEQIENVFQGTADFGRKVTCPISRSGDLVAQTWLQITLPDLRDYYYDTPPVAEADAPAILSARYASSNSAYVTFIEPTSSVVGNVTYRVTVTTTGAGGDKEATGNASPVLVDGLVDVGNSTHTATVQRLADGSPSGNASLAVDVVALKWTDAVAHAIVRSCELEIGGQRIDRHVSEWYDIWSELTIPEEKKDGFYEMIGKYDAYDMYDNSFDSSRILYFPLQFFFNKSVGSSIPLVALQFHETKLNFEFRNYDEVIKSSRPISSLLNLRGQTPSMICQLYSNFIYLDTEERRRVASIPHEILIEQCQFLGDAPVRLDNEDVNPTKKIALNFSHPIKEIIFVWNESKTYNANIASTANYAVDGNDYFNTGLPAPNQAIDPIETAKISINGHDRFSERPSSYFRLVQPYMHHTRVPGKKIYVFSFALHPEDIQPSGSCNYSRIDTSHLVIKLNRHATQGRIRAFGIGYNVIKVASGMAGLSFSS
jgi:hypothetical protein